MDVQSKLADLKSKQTQAAQSQGAQPVQGTQPVQPSPASVEQSEEEEAEEESPLAVWSGLRHEFKSEAAVVSDTAKTFWSAVTATDEKGRKELGFRKLPKRSSKFKFFTQVFKFNLLENGIF